MRLKFGIIGCGAIAQDMHIPTLLGAPDVALTTLVDPDVAHARHLAEKFGVAEAVPDLSQAHVRLDAVVICTPPRVRPGLIAQAFSMGLHVLAEKPLANSIDECAEIVSRRDAAGKILAVSHMFRFYPVRARLLDIIAHHGLGSIISIDISEGAPYGWNTRSGYTFRLDEVSGGVLINAGLHSLDSLIQWLGTPEILAYEDDAIGGLESNVRARLKFAPGVDVTFRISRTCRLPSFFRIICAKGTVIFSNRDTVDYRVEISNKTSEHRYPSTDLTTMDCWRAQLTDFISCIHTGARPRADGVEASRVIALMEAMYGIKRARAIPTLAPQPGVVW